VSFLDCGEIENIMAKGHREAKVLTSWSQKTGKVRDTVIQRSQNKI
jgi:hypothetical protein